MLHLVTVRIFRNILKFFSRFILTCGTTVYDPTDDSSSFSVSYTRGRNTPLPNEEGCKSCGTSNTSIIDNKTSCSYSISHVRLCKVSSPMTTRKNVGECQKWKTRHVHVRMDRTGIYEVISCFTSINNSASDWLHNSLKLMGIYLSLNSSYPPSPRAISRSKIE